MRVREIALDKKSGICYNGITVKFLQKQKQKTICVFTQHLLPGVSFYGLRAQNYMKSAKLSTKDKKSFRADFTTVLTLSLVSNTKGLSQREKQDIKECIKDRNMTRALRIIERKYSVREWKSFVESHAAPLMKNYA